MKVVLTFGGITAPPVRNWLVRRSCGFSHLYYYYEINRRTGYYQIACLIKYTVEPGITSLLASSKILVIFLKTVWALLLIRLKGTSDV